MTSMTEGQIKAITVMGVITESWLLSLSLSVSLLSMSSEFHSSSQMIKVYKINLDFHFNHAKVPACLPSASSTASSAAQSSIAGIFALLSLMFRCLEYRKNLLLMLLLTSGCLVNFAVVVALNLVDCCLKCCIQPTIKMQPHIMAAFSSRVHSSQMFRVDVDCIRKEHAEIPALCCVCHWNKSGTVILWVNQIHSSHVGELFREF